MKSNHGLRLKTVRVIILMGIFVAGAAFHLGCGEDKLPPPPPHNTGTVTISGGSA